MRIHKLYPCVLILTFLLYGCGLTATAISNPPPVGHTVSRQFIYPFSFSEENARFKSGFAKRKITPKDTQWLAGFMPSRKGIFIHDDLWAKCLAVEDDRDIKIGIISPDLLGLLPTEARDIRDRISQFFPGKVLIHTTHTHSAPDVMGLWGFGIWSLPLISGRDEGYTSFLKEEAVACMKEAANSLEPSVLSFAQRELKGIAHGPSLIQNDESLLLMHFLSKNHSYVLVNYAVHPDTLYSSYVTADLLYYFYDFVEKETGSEVIYINGAIGGVQPNVGKFMGRWLDAKRLGTLMGQASVEALKSARVSAKKDIFWRTKELRVAVDNKNFIKAAKFGLMPDQRGDDGAIQAEVNYIVMGDAGIITFPGEAFPNIAQNIKPELPDKYKFTFGLINAELGYILFSPDFKSGRYPYHTKVSVGSLLGDEVFRALIELINP